MGLWKTGYAGVLIMFGTSNAGNVAAQQAGSTAQGYGAQAAGVSSNLLPFLTRELTNPQGFSQQQMGAQLGAAEAGAGGATSGLTTEANLASARNRNSGGFSGALDQAARTQGKTVAGASEGIAANNANLQQQQQQDAASGLANQKSMDQNAQLKAMGIQPQDLEAQSQLNKTSGWGNRLGSLLNDAGSAAKLAGGFGIPGFGGF